MCDQLGLASHLVHPRVPSGDDVTLERRVRACQSDDVAGRGEQILQEDSSGFTIQIVVTGETRRQRKEIIDRERLRAGDGTKRRRNQGDRRQERATSNRVHGWAILRAGPAFVQRSE